jgi:hypothetical protein
MRKCPPPTSQRSAIWWFSVRTPSRVRTSWNFEFVSEEEKKHKNTHNTNPAMTDYHIITSRYVLQEVTTRTVKNVLPESRYAATFLFPMLSYQVPLQ